MAVREERVVITLDLDWRQWYHRRQQRPLGVIILRLAGQTVESVNRALDDFFRTRAAAIPLDCSLDVIEAGRVRVVEPS